MKKIVVGGQIDKEEVKALVIQYGLPEYTVDVKSDLDAAMAIKTGGGGALAMALALLGRDNCVTVSMPGKIMPEEEIRESVRSGKKAFGFTAQHKNDVVPIIMDELNKI